jgi:hypothetical protein
VSRGRVARRLALRGEPGPVGLLRPPAVARPTGRSVPGGTPVIPPATTRRDRSAPAGRPTRGDLQGQHGRTAWPVPDACKAGSRLKPGCQLRLGCADGIDRSTRFRESLLDRTVWWGSGCFGCQPEPPPRPGNRGWAARLDRLPRPAVRPTGLGRHSVLGAGRDRRPRDPPAAQLFMAERAGARVVREPRTCRWSPVLAR